MLVLTRYPNESIDIGDNIKIRIVSVEGERVRIGIDAPKDVNIIRDNAKVRHPKVKDKNARDY